MDLNLKFYNTEAVNELMENPLDYLGRFLCKTDKKRALNQIEKFLHQIFVLLKIIQILHPTEIEYKNIKLSQKGKMRSNNEKLDAIMSLTWGPPQIKIKINGEFYSIWYEFSAPCPFDVEEKCKKTQKAIETGEFSEIISSLSEKNRKRFDIIIKKGNFDSMFKIKPKYEEIKKMDMKQSLEYCNRLFEQMEKIDIIIECKEIGFEEWKKEIDTQIIPYFEIYKPNKMILISEFPVPEDVISRLKEKGILTICPFGFDSDTNSKEKELESIIKSI
jgi:hypothetical protein